MLDNRTQLFDENFLIDLIGDDEVTKPIIKDVLDIIPERMELLEKYKKESNLEELRSLAHKMKGSFAQIGAEPTSNILFEIEKASKENDLEFVVNNFDILSSQIEELKKELNDYLG